MKRAKSNNWSGQYSLLASSLLIGIILACGLEGRAVAGDGKSAAKIDLPADLDLVPRHAVGFVHLRAADLWRTDVAKELRYLVDKAGPEDWKAFEKRSPINPATLDRITFIWLSPKMTDPFPTVDPEAMSVLTVVSTSKPFDRIPLIRALGAKEKVYRDNLYYFNEALWSGLFLLDDRTFVIGSEESLIRLFEMSRQKDRTGPLQAPLAEAARKNHVVVGLNPTLLAKQEGAGFLPPPMRSLLTANSAVLTLDLDESIRVNARLEFLNENQAREGETAAKQTLELARQGLVQPIAELEKLLRDPGKESVTDLPQRFAALVGLGFLREVDSQLKQAPLQRKGLAVNLPLEYKNQTAAPLLIASYGSLLMGVRANATFTEVGEKIGGPNPLEEHLRTIAKALEKYRDKHGTYPPPAIYDRDGRPVLSWRVALLPYLGEEALYREFKLDEPWDSLHNKRLLKKMPKSLQVANEGYRYYGSPRWKTTTQVFTGPNTIFEGKQGVRKADVTQKVILLARVANEVGVYWTKPADVSYAADKPLPDVYGKYGNRIQALLTDGTYRAIEKSMNEKDVRALIERSDKPVKAKNPPQLGDLETIWNDLTQHDDVGVKKAWQGIIAMSKIPDRAVPFVKERVKPVPPPDHKRIAQSLVDLKSNVFQKRALAIKELEGFGELAMAAIDEKIADKSYPLEARRQLEALAQNTRTVLSGAELRNLRAIEILEQAGTPEARAVLADLSRGGAGTVLTEQARRALTRLTQRAGEGKSKER